MLIKHEGENADHIFGGAEWSYKPLLRRAQPKISASILAIDKEGEELLDGLLVAKAQA
jgi:hypothetical protein